MEIYARLRYPLINFYVISRRREIKWIKIHYAGIRSAKLNFLSATSQVELPPISFNSSAFCDEVTLPREMENTLKREEKAHANGVGGGGEGERSTDVPWMCESPSMKIFPQLVALYLHHVKKCGENAVRDKTQGARVSLVRLLQTLSA